MAQVIRIFQGPVSIFRCADMGGLQENLLPQLVGLASCAHACLKSYRKQELEGLEGGRCSMSVRVDGRSMRTCRS